MVTSTSSWGVNVVLYVRGGLHRGHVPGHVPGACHDRGHGSHHGHSDVQTDYLAALLVGRDKAEINTHPDRACTHVLSIELYP